MTQPLRIEKLQRGHAVESFDCNREALNRFLIRYALQNQQAGASQTYLVCKEHAQNGRGIKRPPKGLRSVSPRLAARIRALCALSEAEVVGYYTLVVGQVEYDDAPERLKKGLARHPVPIMLLVRLAVAASWQGKGLGAGLLKDSMLRTVQAADIAGIRAFAVHAKDDEAKEFYERFDFVASPSDPYHLFRLMKDVRVSSPDERLDRYS